MTKKQANMLDDLLERATAALRDVETADAPPAGVINTTLAALDTARRPLRRPAPPAGSVKEYSA